MVEGGQQGEGTYIRPNGGTSKGFGDPEPGGRLVINSPGDERLKKFGFTMFVDRGQTVEPSQTGLWSAGCVAEYDSGLGGLPESKPTSAQADRGYMYSAKEDPLQKVMWSLLVETHKKLQGTTVMELMACTLSKGHWVKVLVQWISLGTTPLQIQNHLILADLYMVPKNCILGSQSTVKAICAQLPADMTSLDVEQYQLLLD